MWCRSEELRKSLINTDGRTDLPAKMIHQSSPDPEDLVNINNDDIPAFDPSLDPYGPEGFLSLDIDIFSKFMSRADNRLLSKPVIVRGIPWRILAICR